MDQTHRRFGIRLRSWRREQGLSLRSLARRAQASEAYITQIENGLRTPPDPEAAIGRHLYPIVDDQPDLQERWLWATWSTMHLTYLYLAWVVLEQYEPGRTADSVFSVGPEAPAPLDLPVGVHAEDFLAEFGGWDQSRTRLLAGLMQAEPATIIDWLLQTTVDIRLDFAAQLVETADQVPVSAKLRYPVGDRECVSYVWPG